MCLKTRQDCDCYECVEARRADERGADVPPDLMEPWRSAFDQAYREVQVEVCRAKIRAKLSKDMETTAERVLALMLEDVQANILRARKAKTALPKAKKKPRGR